MAFFSYFALTILAIQTAYCSNLPNARRATHIPLSQRRSTASSHLNRRTGIATEQIKINEVLVSSFLTSTYSDIFLGVLVRRFLRRRVF
jgi:hypothetical protein